MGVDLFVEERAERELVLEFKSAGQTLGQGFIGAVEGRDGQSGDGGVHIQGFLGKRRAIPARLAYWGVRQLAVSATCVGLPPRGDRSEAAGCPERSWLNRHAVQVS